MAELPTYTSTALIEPAPVVSSAPVWQSVQKIGSALGQIGEEEQLKQNKIQLEANRYEAGADVLKNASKYYIEASQMKDPQEGLDFFNKSMDGFAKGTLTNVKDKENKIFIQNLLSHQTNKYNLQLNNKVVKQAQNEAFLKFTSSFDQFSNQMSNDFYNGDHNAGMTFYTKSQDMINDGVRSGYLDKERASIYEAHLDDEMHKQVVLGQYITHKKSGTQKQFEKSFFQGTSFNSWFSATGKQRMRSMFRTIDKQFAQEDGFNQATYDEHKKQLVFDAYHGRGLDKESLANMYAVAPKKYQALSNSIQDAHINFTMYDANRFSTPTALKNKISELTSEDNIPASERQHEINLDVAKRLKNHLTELQENPAHTVEEYPAYKKMFQSTIDQYPKYSKLFTESVAKLRFERTLGVEDKNIRVLNNSDAREVVNDFKQIPLGKQPDKISQYVQQYPAQSRQYVIRDLQKNGLPQASQFTIRITQSPEFRQYAPDAITAWSKPNGIKDYSGILEKENLTSQKLMQIVNNANSVKQYASVLYGMGGDINKPLNSYLSHVQLLAAQLMQSQNMNAKTASNLAGQTLNAGMTFDNYKGYTYFHPNDVSSSSVHGGFAYLQHLAFNSDLKIPIGIRGTMPNLLPEQYKNTLLANSHFIPTADQRGLILVDHSGSPIRTVDKKEFIVNFKKLQDKTSDFYKNSIKYNLMHRVPPLIEGGLELFPAIKIGTKTLPEQLGVGLGER